MREFLSGLGFVFEGAFKLGLLQKIAPERAEGFRKSLFEKLRESLREELVSELEKPLQEWERLGTYIDEHVAEEKYAKLAYLHGYYAGRLYGMDKEGALLEKYHMGEESGDIVWQNADLLFIKEKTFYVVDFKLAGFVFWIKRVFETGRSKDENQLPRIPVINYGVPVNLSVGELNFVEFLRAFTEQRRALEELRCVFVEVKGFAQLLCYATDYLIEKKPQNLREVVLELIYPASEPLRVRFYVEKETAYELEPFRDSVREIYRSLKDKECPYDMLDDSFEKVVGKRERVLKKLRLQIEELEREVEARQRWVRSIKPDSINLCRQDVGQKLPEFIRREEPCKAICLLHSAGSGKTSTIRDYLLRAEGKHLVIYMASRLRLIDKEMEKVKASGREDIGIIRERRKPSGQKLLRHSGDSFEDTQSSEGIIKRTVEKIAEYRQKGLYNQIWAFVTQQANTDTDTGETIRHLIDPKILNPVFLKRWHIHVILDEFFGYRNGLYAISGMLEFLQKVNRAGGRANLYLFDANGYSPHLLKRLLEEFREHEVIPDSIVLSPFEESLYLDINGIPLEIHAKHGYPAGELILHRRFFLWVEKEEELIKQVVKYLKATLDRNSTGFLFLQDKGQIVELSHHLEKEGLTTLIATASSKKSPRDINEGSQDVILGTSSVSRGLDFSRPHKPVNHIYILVTDWGIEQNLVEILQAISRARGDEETEKRPKHLHLLYVIPKEKDYVIDHIESLVDFRDRELIQLIYRREQINQRLILDQVVGKIVEQFVKAPEGEVLIPVPAQHRSHYRANRVSELESIKTFLEDVYLMENKRNPEGAWKILNFMHLLSSAVYFSTNDVPEDPESGRYRYYHPYLLVEGQVSVKFDNEKRRALLAMLKEIEGILRGHDEEKSERVRD
ncbi:MAG: hypothetical protein D6804_01740, partial [Aquificota bacterium]